MKVYPLIAGIHAYL